MELRPEHLVMLRWRDWPDLPAFPRRRRDLGLLHVEAVSSNVADDAKPSDVSDPATSSDEADHDGSDHARAAAAG